VRRIPEQSVPFLYCGLMADTNVPTFEFLTTRHDADWLGGMMQLFVREVRLSNVGRPVTLRHVVTDFSYAIIHAVLSAFNNMNLPTYIRTTYSILSHRVTADHIRSMTFITLCAAHSRNRIHSMTFITLCVAHSMKALSRPLIRKESDEKK